MINGRVLLTQFKSYQKFQWLENLGRGCSLPSMFKALGLIPLTKTDKTTQILDCRIVHYTEKGVHYV